MPSLLYPCFADKLSLKTGINDYNQNGAASPTVAHYGPIESWCFPDVLDFSFLFSSFDTQPEGGLRKLMREVLPLPPSSTPTAGAPFEYQDIGFSYNPFVADLSAWDVSKVTSMKMLAFENFVFNADISSWDISAVTDLAAMFEGAYSFNQDLSTWNVAAVTDMSNMFDLLKNSTKIFPPGMSLW